MDFLNINAMLTEEELRFVTMSASLSGRGSSHASRAGGKIALPEEIAPEMGAMGLLGMHLNGTVARARVRSPTASRPWSSRLATRA
jgi:hypothetical protein